MTTDELEHMAGEAFEKARAKETRQAKEARQVQLPVSRQELKYLDLGVIFTIDFIAKSAPGKEMKRIFLENRDEIGFSDGFDPNCLIELHNRLHRLWKESGE